MNPRLRIGLVGCGSVSQRGILPHLSQPDAQKKVRVAAVADAFTERAQQTAARFEVPAYFSSVEAMLAGADLDVVLVATPIPYHFQNAMAAIQAGKHVYVQKTMTVTLAEANALLAARDRAQIKLAAAPGYELFPTTEKMREIVSGRVLGQVYLAYGYTFGFGHLREPIRSGEGVLAEIDPGWYYGPGGGPLPDAAVYSLQLMTSVLGPVRRVTAFSNQGRDERTWRGRSIPVAIDDNTMVMMEFGSGALGMVAGSDCWRSARIPWGALSLYGTEGALEVTQVQAGSGYPTHFEVQGGEWGDRADKQSAPRQFNAQLSDQPYLQGAHLTIDEPHVYADIMDLADAILEERPPRSTGEQGRHIVEIIEKAYQAAATGQSQTLETTL